MTSCDHLHDEEDGAGNTDATQDGSEQQCEYHQYHTQVGYHYPVPREGERGGERGRERGRERKSRP